jgi:hypothetical protein
VPWARASASTACNKLGWNKSCSINCRRRASLNGGIFRRKCRLSSSMARLTRRCIHQPMAGANKRSARAMTASIHAAMASQSAIVTVAATCCAPSQRRFASWPVSRVLSEDIISATAIHLGRGSLRASSNQPGRRPGSRLAPRLACAPCRPYSVLLPVGFAVPLPLPVARCALTTPFHPCRSAFKPAAAVCFLWHFPWGYPRRPLAATVDPWSPDFPPPSVLAARATKLGSGRPASWPCD